MEHPLVTRKEAIASGQSWYFTGKPCKRGHIDKRLTKYKVCAACNREKVTAYRMKNPEWKKAYDAAYVTANPERIAEYKRKHYAMNAEKVKARVKQWAIDNRERAQQSWNAATRTYRAKLRANGGTHTAADVKDLLNLQRHRCACCGVKLSTYHVDHIVPLSRGGSNDKINLQILCAPCNLNKSAKDPLTFMQERGFLI